MQKKILKKLMYVLIPLILVGLGISLHFWNRYINKYNLINKFSVDKTKDVYLLGTIDKKHFNRFYNYSMEDMLSVIEYLQPDLVMLEAKDEHHKDYGIIDGKIDACVAFSYCLENKIPVKLVDWWIIDNIYPVSATTNLRDDNIFIKISRHLKEAKPNSKILVISNSDHYSELVERFEIAGHKKEIIDDKKGLFKTKWKNFEFPAIVTKVWRDRAYFYAYSFPAEVKNSKGLSDEIKNLYIDADHEAFYLKEIKYCKYLNNNILYR